MLQVATTAKVGQPHSIFQTSREICYKVSFFLAINNYVTVLLGNREHLKYFKNVYCVKTNHSKDQYMRANHKTTK